MWDHIRCAFGVPVWGPKCTRLFLSKPFNKFLGLLVEGSQLNFCVGLRANARTLKHLN